MCEQVRRKKIVGVIHHRSMPPRATENSSIRLTLLFHGACFHLVHRRKYRPETDTIYAQNAKNFCAMSQACDLVFLCLMSRGNTTPPSPQGVCIPSVIGCIRLECWDCSGKASGRCGKCARTPVKTLLGVTMTSWPPILCAWMDGCVDRRSMNISSDTIVS